MYFGYYTTMILLKMKRKIRRWTEEVVSFHATGNHVAHLDFSRSSLQLLTSASTSEALKGASSAMVSSQSFSAT